MTTTKTMTDRPGDLLIPGYGNSDRPLFEEFPSYYIPNYSDMTIGSSQGQARS